MLNQVNQRFKFDIKLRFYMEGKSGLNFKRFSAGKSSDSWHQNVNGDEIVSKA